MADEATQLEDPPVDDLAALNDIGDPTADLESTLVEGAETPDSGESTTTGTTTTESAPSTPAAPATPAPAAPPAAGTAPSTTFRDAIAARGVPLASRDDEGAINELSSFFARDLPQIQQLAQLGQQLAPHMDEFRQFLAQKNGQQPQRQQAAPPQAGYPTVAQAAADEWMPLPEYDPAWSQMVETDADGNVVRSKPGAMLDLPQRIAAYERAVSQRGQTIVKDFPTLVDQRATTVARREAQAVFNEMMAARERKQFVDDAISSNESWMFDIDPATGQRRQDLHGQPILTQDGINYRREVATLAQLGLTDKTVAPEVQHWLALRLLGKLPGQPAQAAVAQTAPAAAAPDPKATRQAALIEQNRQSASRTAGRGGSATNQKPGKLSPDQNSDLPPDNMLRDAFALAGIGDKLDDIGDFDQ